MNKSPEFWWQPSLSPASTLLVPFSWAYGFVSGRRLFKKPKARSRLPVICIGNFVVGGTGKTPFAIALAGLLRDEGFAPGFLLRGYGGREKGPLLVDPARHRAEDVGDEALLLAAHGPTVISSDRPKGALLAETQPIDLILMDDGFQNPALAKDLNLVLVDCTTGLGNGYCLPAGPLRAPADRQIIKTDCLVLVGEGEAADEVVHLAGRKGLPILHAHLKPQSNDALKDTGLFAFAGIGRPQKFFKSLKDLGYSVRKTREFADHHKYEETEARALLTEAENDDLQLVTTQKDMVRLASSKGELFRWLVAKSQVLDVSMKIDDAERLNALIREKLRAKSFEG
ncbi:tetraacyldisaccharide 4'-kinase [Labrenzia sp. EL_13]|uniref:tetraacyldisaccharide 4'-kinase n=1 Tax=Roseibium album TaxID=311410 RepID=UPI000CF0C42A|nr:tetraacyldisaccharide 4'-kinase [Labrenzia sp. EL_142]MBG6199291.1 tetraacyldisaccharide 4'-kinase [Labrenzia sp. EL_13]